MEGVFLRSWTWFPNVNKTADNRECDLIDRAEICIWDNVISGSASKTGAHILETNATVKTNYFIFFVLAWSGFRFCPFSLSLCTYVSRIVSSTRLHVSFLFYFYFYILWEVILRPQKKLIITVCTRMINWLEDKSFTIIFQRPFKHTVADSAPDYAIFESSLWSLVNLLRCTAKSDVCIERGWMGSDNMNWRTDSYESY